MSDLETTIAPHPLLRRVAPADIGGRTCAICNQAYLGATQVGDELIESRTFVEALVADSEEPPVAAGLTLTKSDEPGRTVYRHRDPFAHGGTSITTEVRPIYCSDCIKAAAEQLGMPPAGDVVLNQARELRERAETAERERDEARGELEAAKRGYAIVKDLQKLLEAEQAPTTKPKGRKAATA